MTDSPQSLISTLFAEHMENAAHVAGELDGHMIAAAEMLAGSLLNNGKILLCANGSANSLAQYFCTNLLNRFEQDRPALPAINLGADATTFSALCRDNRFNETFSRQVRALGQEGDTLFAIVDDGQKANLIQAIQAAHASGLGVVVLSAKEHTDITSLLDPEDQEIALHNLTPVQATGVFILILNALCTLIDHRIFGG
jgi:D-sedoheptulose 7-phosphate isomerase